MAPLAEYDIVVTLRERGCFPASSLGRLPRLKLLIASGRRNSLIDHAAAEAHGVTVYVTASSSTPPAEPTWALLLGLARALVIRPGRRGLSRPAQRALPYDSSADRIRRPRSPAMGRRAPSTSVSGAGTTAPRSGRTAPVHPRRKAALVPPSRRADPGTR